MQKKYQKMWDYTSSLLRDCNPYTLNYPKIGDDSILESKIFKLRAYLISLRNEWNTSKERIKEINKLWKEIKKGGD